MIIQGQVQAPPPLSATDGNNYAALQGKQLELIVSELTGKYYTQTLRGNTFIGATASAGVVPPIFSNTAQTFGIWNPSGSGKNIVPVNLKVGLVTVGVVTDNFALAVTLNAGSQQATGSPITAGTFVAPVNALLGSGTASISKFAPATITAGAAPTYLKPTGISNFMAATPAAANNFWQLGEDYDGSLIIPPGVVLYVCNNIAGVATWNICMTWVEIPI